VLRIGGGGGGCIKCGFDISAVEVLARTSHVNQYASCYGQGDAILKFSVKIPLEEWPTEMLPM
jgi:hypothetical protein